MPRLKPLWLEISPIVERMQRAVALAVACDFDGTLTSIVQRPEQAELPVRARDALLRLARHPDVEVAVLSGRSLDDLASRVAIDGIFLAGQSGLETRDANGARTIHVEAGHRVPPELRAEMEAWCRRFPGAWVEDKTLTLALHFREVEPSRHRVFINGARRHLAHYADRVVPVLGKRVFEVMPAIGRDKAFALEHWLGDRTDDRLVFYLGDDTNDEPALAWMRSHGGISVAVGRATSNAEFGLTSPSDVIWYLEWLEREWSERTGGQTVTDREKRRVGA